MRRTKANQPGQSGFSLIELALLLTIVGLLTGAAMDTYRQYSQTKIVNDTEVRRTLVTNALSQYVRFFGRLPCPADPSLTPADANAGVEVCHPSPGGANGCIGEVCRVDGRRDTSADGNLTVDKVLIGAVPYVTIGLTLNDTIDGWGGKMTYAVSEYVTSGAYNDNYGTVNKQIKQSGTGNIMDGSPVGENILALVSHGPDRKGAYNYEGNLIRPCAGAGIDLENCDGDSTFIQTSSTSNCQDDNTCMTSYAPGANFYDDAFSVFQISRDSDKWEYASASEIKNKTGGAVGIGVSVPDTSTGRKLHVGGNLRAQDARADNYCNPSESNCFGSDIIGGAGINCGSGMMYGVSSQNVLCANVVDPSTLTPSTCASGTYVTGIDASGALICN